MRLKPRLIRHQKVVSGFSMNYKNLNYEIETLALGHH